MFETSPLFSKSTMFLPAIKPQHISLPASFELREVQKVMRANLAKSYLAGNRKVILQAPTGSGKTILAGDLFKNALEKKPHSRCLFLVPRNSLLEQTVEVFEKVFGYSVSVMQGIDPRLDLSNQIQVATIQTFKNRMEKVPAFKNLKFNIACVDEAHIQFKGRDLINAELIIGLTATPFSRGLGKYYQDLVKSVSAHDLTEQGVITKIHVKSAMRQINTSNLTVNSSGEYDASEEELEANEIVGDVYEEWEKSEDMQGRKFLGFTKSIATAVELADIWKRNGHKVEAVHSKMSEDDINTIFELFKSGVITGLFSVVKLIEGFDMPDASALLICTSFAPSKHDNTVPSSRNRYVQMIGRGRRSDPNDPDKVCLIHDHGENYIKFGHPDNMEIGFDVLDDGKVRKKEEPPIEREITPVVCGECSSYIDQGNSCSFCGTELKNYSEIVDGEVINYINGEMVEVEAPNDSNPSSQTKRNRDDSSETKAEFYGGLKLHAKQSQYKEGWASYAYKERYGVWPNAYKDAPIANKTQDVQNWIKYLNIKRAYSNG